MYKCGITGSNGVLGSEFTKIKNFKFYKFRGDITSLKDIDDWLSKTKLDLIIHFAAVVPTYLAVKDYNFVNNVNFNGTKNLIKIINKRQKNLKWFFFASTSHVYQISNKKKKINENQKKVPYTKYGLTKLKAEKHIAYQLNGNIPCCIGRIFSFAHFKQDKSYFVPSMFNKIKKNKEKILILNNVNHYRDFIAVQDICILIKKLWIQKKRGTFNFGASKKINLKIIPFFFKKKLKKKFKIIFKDTKQESYIVSDNNKLKKNLGIKNLKNITYVLNDFIKNKKFN